MIRDMLVVGEDANESCLCEDIVLVGHLFGNILTNGQHIRLDENCRIELGRNVTHVLCTTASATSVSR